MLLSLKRQLEQISSVRFQDFELFSGEAIHGQHPGIDFFIDYWERLHQLGATHPRRADIKPKDLVRYLPHFVLMDIEDEDDLKIRIRLIGTHVATFYGEITGQLIEEMPNEGAVRRIKTLSRLILDEREPKLSITPGFGERQKHLVAYSVYAPVFSENGAVKHIMLGSFVELLSQTPLAERRHSRTF